LLKARIETPLSPTHALNRLQDELRSDDEPPSVHPELGVYGQVDGNHFSARRSAAPGGPLQGELAGFVEAKAHGASVHARAVGGDWAAAVSGAGVSAAAFSSYLLTRADVPGVRFILIVVGACSLAAGVHAVASVLADWRFLMRQLRALFPDEAK
jgi:hypothetical protein